MGANTFGDGRTEAQERADDSRMIHEGMRAAFPPTTDAITRKLDFMRADIEEPGSSPAARLIAGHAALLLKAVEAALKLADDWAARAVKAETPFDSAIAACAVQLHQAITTLNGEDIGRGEPQ